MKKNIKEVITLVRRGSFFHIRYKVDLPLSAAGKKMDMQVYKIVECNTRTGVCYGNIGKVRQKYPDGKVGSREPWYDWIDSNVLLRHKTSGKEYLAVMPIDNHGMGSKAEWYINGMPVSSRAIRESGYVIPSYFNDHDHGDIPVFMTIGLDNILSIRSRGIDWKWEDHHTSH